GGEVPQLRQGRGVRHRVPAGADRRRVHRRGGGTAPTGRERSHMSIRVRNVTKRFGDLVALDNVSVDVPSGGLTALLGPSGGGKSTLLRVIAGLEPPDEGSVHIDGVEPTHLSPQRRGVGFVFQHYAAFKHLTVRRNVAFGLEIRKRPRDEVRARVDELLELV